MKKKSDRVLNIPNLGFLWFERACINETLSKEKRTARKAKEITVTAEVLSGNLQCRSPHKAKINIIALCI
jgi:hypothetical protein